MVVREAEASALSDMARSTTAAKKVYTGPAFETGHGKGDLIGANLGNVYGEGSFGPVRALNSEVSDHIRGAALAPAAQPAPMVPGVSYHTPPPGYRGPDVIQNAVPSGVTVHTPPPPKPVIGDKCGTGDGYRRLDASPPRPAANTVPVRSAVAQLITVDAFCPKHGKYGGQVRPGEKLECPLCKAEKNRPIIPIR